MKEEGETLKSEDISVEQYFKFIEPVPKWNSKTMRNNTYETEYYSIIYEKNKDKRFFLSWNWAAAFFSYFWCVYRKSYYLAVVSGMLFLTFWLIPPQLIQVLGKFGIVPDNLVYPLGALSILISLILYFVICGSMANYFYQKEVVGWIKNNYVYKQGTDAGIVVFLLFGNIAIGLVPSILASILKIIIGDYDP